MTTGSIDLQRVKKEYKEYKEYEQSQGVQGEEPGARIQESGALR
jgi:hypothetical protein